MTNENEIKPKKPIWRKWWFWPIAIFVIFILIGLMGGWDEEKKPEKQVQPTNQEQNQPGEKLGFSEEEQKEIFFEIVQAEDKATKDAIEKYPTPYSDHLQIGQKYQLSEKTPLMPELNPVDPISAVQKMKSIPAGGTIKIIKTTMKERTPWYYVEAEGMGYGWINSIVLIGQFEKADQEQYSNQIDFERTLTEKYKKEVVKKYNLTDEQLIEITTNGITKHWPMPKF